MRQATCGKPPVWHAICTQATSMVSRQYGKPPGRGESLTRPFSRFDILGGFAACCTEICDYRYPAPAEPNVCSIERAVKEKTHPMRAAGNNFWRRAAVLRAPGASSSAVFWPTLFIVLTGHNRLMSSNAGSHCIDRFGCFLRYLSRCVSLTMVLFVTLGPS